MGSDKCDKISENVCDNKKVSSGPNIIDLDKNRIVYKRNKLKLWTRPLSNIFKNPFSNLNLLHSNNSITSAKNPSSTQSNVKSEVKIDIALIKKLEDEIYKRENSRNGISRDSDDDGSGDFMFNGDTRLVFKNDTSAFKRGNKPVLLVDSRKLEPLLLKKSEAEIDKQQPVYVNISEANSTEKNVESSMAGTQSIIIVDNSNFYPILMRYDINNDVIQNIHSNGRHLMSISATEKCQRQFEITKAIREKQLAPQHNLFLDEKHSEITMDFPMKNVLTQNNDANENFNHCQKNSKEEMYAAVPPRKRRISAEHHVKNKKSFLRNFLLQRRSLHLSFDKNIESTKLPNNNNQLPPSLIDDDGDYVLASVKYKISPQLYQKLNEFFNSPIHKNRLKFMVYKKLYKHLQTLETHDKNRKYSYNKRNRRRSLPLIDENSLNKFCRNWENYCYSTSSSVMKSEPLNWSTPDLINNNIYFTDICKKLSTSSISATSSSKSTSSSSKAKIKSDKRNQKKQVILLSDPAITESNNRISLSTTTSTISNSFTTNRSSSTCTSSSSSSRSTKTTSTTQQNSSSKSTNDSMANNNMFVRKLRPIKQRASFRLKRHSVGSTDVVKTWVYRRRCLFIIFFILFYYYILLQ